VVGASLGFWEDREANCTVDDASLVECMSHLNRVTWKGFPVSGMISRFLPIPGDSNSGVAVRRSMSMELLAEKGAGVCFGGSVMSVEH